MAVDPKARALIDAMEGAFPPLDESMSAAELRALIKQASHVITVAPEEVCGVDNRVIPGPLGDIPVRIYRPLDARREPLPVVVFFHGGGWVVCDLDSHDDICRAITNASRCVVVSVDYRLAPEHPFPEPLEDSYAATAWVADHGDEIGVDSKRIAVVGDSAGGNLAAAVCLMARDRGGPSIAFQVLVYPVTNHDFTTPSHVNTGEGYFLKSDEVQWYWRRYIAKDTDAVHPYASPLRASDHGGLPPALVITAEHDPLRDEGEAYAEALRRAGVAVESTRYDGMFHSFLSFLTELDSAAAAKRQIGDSLQSALSAVAKA
jgi:acetyl esterase